MPLESVVRGTLEWLGYVCYIGLLSIRWVSGKVSLGLYEFQVRCVSENMSLRLGDQGVSSVSPSKVGHCFSGVAASPVMALGCEPGLPIALGHTSLHLLGSARLLPSRYPVCRSLSGLSSPSSTP